MQPEINTPTVSIAPRLLRLARLNKNEDAFPNEEVMV